MNRWLIIAVCVPFFLFDGESSAQTGVKIGMSASSFTYQGRPSPYLEFDVDLRPYLGYDIEWIQIGKQNPLISPQISVFHQIRLSERFSFRPELGFIQKGVNFSQFDFERIVYKVVISYFELPASLHYQYLKKEKFNSQLFFGGYGSMKINSVKKTSFHESEIKKEPIKNTERFDFGIQLGLHFNFELSRQTFLLELRIFQGLSNVFYEKEELPAIYREVQKVHHTGLNLSAGYVF